MGNLDRLKRTNQFREYLYFGYEIKWINIWLMYVNNKWVKIIKRFSINLHKGYKF